MSEEKKSSSYMQELDKWTDTHVIDVLVEVLPNASLDFDSDRWDAAVAKVKKAIREKVLESYKNGRGTRMGGNAPTNLPTNRRYPVPMRQR